MRVQTFTARSPAEAIAAIRQEMGPDAVVLHVRRVAGRGLAQLWRAPEIEVLASVPENPEPKPDRVREERDRLGSPMADPSDPAAPAAPATPPAPASAAALYEPAAPEGAWRLGAWLERSGLLPLQAQRVMDQIQAAHGPAPPPSLADELDCAKAALRRHWRAAEPAPAQAAGPHLFVGPAGAGKTSCLLKWLTRVVLLDERPARVWRLDGTSANTADLLSVHAEILNVPLERAWNGPVPPAPDEVQFIDLPGYLGPEPATALRQLMAQCPDLRLHLVLNLAYDATLLLAQARAYAALPVTDLILTHADEEPRWGKVWNLALGTNFSIRWLATGQNIPSDLVPATPAAIFSRQFPSK